MRKCKRQTRTGRKKSNCLLLTDLGATTEEENQILCGAVLHCRVIPLYLQQQIAEHSYHIMRS